MRSDYWTDDVEQEVQQEEEAACHCLDMDRAKEEIETLQAKVEELTPRWSDEKPESDERIWNTDMVFFRDGIGQLWAYNSYKGQWAKITEPTG